MSERWRDTFDLWKTRSDRDEHPDSEYRCDQLGDEICPECGAGPGDQCLKRAMRLGRRAASYLALRSRRYFG